MKELNYIGDHLPKGKYEVPEEKAPRLLKLPEWEEPGVKKKAKLTKEDLWKKSEKELRVLAGTVISAKCETKEELVKEILEEL